MMRRWQCRRPFEYGWAKDQYKLKPVAKEDLDKVITGFEQSWTAYFFIMAYDEKAGVIRIVEWI